MIIERTTAHSILPETIDALVATQNVHTYHSDYGYRPPLGIFNIALNKVINSFDEVLNELDILIEEQLFRDLKNSSTGFEKKLLAAQENLLKSIVELFDANLNILRCFYIPAIGSKNKNFWKEVAVDDYWQAIKSDFFEPISKIVNVVKHENRQLKFFAIFNEENLIPGYFVESIDENGRILPDRTIHVPVRSSYDLDAGYDTAFSFYRDLRYLFWGVYFVSHHLSISISKITKKSLNPSDLPEHGRTGEMICKIAKRIVSLPVRFYRDELNKDFPSVLVAESLDETILRLIYPDTNRLLIASEGQYKVTSIFVSDGVSTVYKLPYSTGGEL